MTKFILHGGYTSNPVQSNKDFFGEIVRDIPNGGTVLLVYFARPTQEHEKLFAVDVERIKENSGGKKVKFVMASEANFTEELSRAAAIYMRGGTTRRLLHVLKEHPDFSQLISGKTIAGSSAGAYVLAKHFFSQDTGEVETGLGILRRNVVAHYDGNQNILKLLKEAGPQWPLLVLRDCELAVIVTDQ
ncbi:MAG: Type 1 glutamine amidotransferase-like domain-containing protein [Candidatus Andersenbacteria bacterium]